MSSNEEKALMATEVSPVVSTSSSDPLSSPEEDKCLLTPLSLEFDPLSWKLDENKSNNCSPEHCPATAALIDDSVHSKDLMSDSVLSCDLLTMDDNCDQNTNYINGDKCGLNGQLIEEVEPTLNSEFESNGWPSEPIVQQNNLINLNAVNHNECESDVMIDSLSVQSNGLEQHSTNECQIASLAQSNPFSEESTNQSISLMSEFSEQNLLHGGQSDQESDAVNVETAHVMATKLANECLSNALHENALHLQTDQTLNSSSSLSDSSLSDHMSSDSVESSQSASQSSTGSTRKKKKNRKSSKSSASKAQSSAPVELTSKKIETKEAKVNSIEANKSVDSLEDNRNTETKAEINGRPKKYEMIIRENTPQELPPDVVRSNSRVEEHFENLTINLANIRNRFEKGLEENRNSQSPNLDKSKLQRSQSIHLRMQKYQSAASGEKEIDSSDEEINESKEKETERVVFSELSSLKSQWETGSVSSNTEEAERNKEELEALRKNLSLGRSESLKQVYERAIKESNTTEAANRSDAVVLDSAVKIGSIKEKFETGKLEYETEEERIERLKKEREEEIHSIAERETAAKEARNKFKQIDATATKGHTPQQNGHSNHVNGVNGVTKKPVNGQVVKSGDTNGDDVSIDSAQLQQRRSYFENLPKEAPKEPKRHQITPPRDVVKVYESNVEDSHSNSNIIKSSDVIEDIPKGDTAKKMLTKFKALENKSENQTNGAPKPLKRITPPRDVTDSNNKKETTPERDPNIIRSSLKTEDDIKVEPEKARNLKAKFENWSAEIDRQNSKNNGYDDEEEFIPHIDTTKNLRKKFETAFKEEMPADKPKVRVNRFVCETGDSGSDLCYVCHTKLYPMEKLEFSGIRLHKNCFRCIKCKCNLRLDNFTTMAEKLYCIPHYKQLFMERGNYDEGFGLEQHKDKWNNKCINNNDLIVNNNNNNNSSLICDENANDAHIDYSNQSVSDASDNDF